MPKAKAASWYWASARAALSAAKFRPRSRPRALRPSLCTRWKPCTGKNNPVVRENASVQDALFVMTRTGAAGATSIVDKKGRLLGYFTDGDLRRILQTGADVLNKNITEVMTKNPYHILDTVPAIEAAKMIHATHVDLSLIHI